jgi:hypothetical protein
MALDDDAIGRLGLARRRLSGHTLKAAFRPAVFCRQDEDTTFATLLYSNCMTSPGAVLFRTGVLRDVLPFRQSLVPVDDWDIYLRASLHGPFRFIPVPVLRWRMHSANTSANLAGMRRSYHNLMLDIATANVPPEFRRQVRSVLLYRFVANVYAVSMRTNRRPYAVQDLLMAARVAVRCFLRI